MLRSPLYYYIAASLLENEEYSSSEDEDNLLRNEVKDLINLVRERRCVWDPTCAHYRNRAVRQKTWHEICGLLDPAFFTLDDKQKNKVVFMRAKKWSNLRLTYSNCRKSRDKTKPYVHAKSLQFLDPILDRKALINDSMISDDDKTNDNDFKLSDDDTSQQSIEWLNEVFVDENGETVEDPPTKKRRLSDKKPNKDDKEITSLLMNMVEREQNEDAAFFRSITSTVSNLSENSKFEFRIQVLKLLNSLRIKDARMARKEERISPDSETE